MSNPANQAGAARQARAMLARPLPGSRRGSGAGHLARAEAAAFLKLSPSALRAKAKAGILPGHQGPWSAAEPA